MKTAEGEAAPIQAREVLESNGNRDQPKEDPTADTHPPLVSAKLQCNDRFRMCVRKIKLLLLLVVDSLDWKNPFMQFLGM